MQEAKHDGHDSCTLLFSPPTDAVASSLQTLVVNLSCPLAPKEAAGPCRSTVSSSAEVRDHHNNKTVSVLCIAALIPALRQGTVNKIMEYNMAAGCYGSELCVGGRLKRALPLRLPIIAPKKKASAWHSVQAPCSA